MSFSVNLTGEVALVTGSSRGLGLTFARALADSGAHVVINGRDEAAAAQTRQALSDEGLSVSDCVFDITDERAVQAGVDRIIKDRGVIDILVNNAGRQIRGPLVEFPLASWNEVLDINLTGAFLVAKAVAAHMIPRKKGKIVNVCSLQSELGRRTIAPYSASKGGLRMLTRAMAVEWAAENIQVNGIGPGYFLTEMTRALADDAAFDSWLKGRTPAGRWGDPRELVAPLLLLCSDGSSFMNGHIIYVDGGLSISV